MHQNILSLSLLFTGLFFISGCENPPTTIRGTLGHQANLLYSSPDLAVCYEGFVDTLIPDPRGKFDLKLKLKESRFVIFTTSVSGKKYFLPVLPGESYQISIGKNQELSVEGPNKEGIELYQSVMNFNPSTMNFSQFKNATVSREEMIKRVKQKELAPFRTLLDQKKITSSFWELISYDRDCFYAFVSAWLYLWDMLAIYRKPETEAGILSEKNTMNRLQQIFDRYRPEDENLMKSPSWCNYALFMYIGGFRPYAANHITRDDIESLFDPDLHFSFWFEQIRESFPDPVLEPALALLLYQKGVTEGMNEVEASQPAYRYFNEKFPGSLYFPYLQPHMKSTLAFFAEHKPDSSSIHFVGDSIPNLSALLSRFRGKKLYVDVWASWCAPCRSEFQYKDSLEVILNRNDITPLYISLDEARSDKKWKALVYSYGLKGYHYRATPSFRDDLRTLYRDEKDGKKGIFIPWYLFVDENGTVVHKHFKRPSAIVSTKRFFD